MAIRGFFKRVEVEEGVMAGYVLVERDKALGDRPIACVNIPLCSQETSKEVAETLAKLFNEHVASQPCAA